MKWLLIVIILLSTHVKIKMFLIKLATIKAYHSNQLIITIIIIVQIHCEFRQKINIKVLIFNNQLVTSHPIGKEVLRLF